MDWKLYYSKFTSEITLLIGAALPFNGFNKVIRSTCMN